MNWQRIKRIIVKEFIQMRRDPKMLAPIIVSPILQLIIFGYAATTDIKHISTAVLDGDNTQQSRELVSKFENSGYFSIEYYVERPADMIPLLDSEKARVGLEIQRGFARNLAHGWPAQVQVVVDGTDSTTASTVLTYVAGVIARFSEDVLTERQRKMGGHIPSLPGIEPRVRVWYNPDLRSVNFMIPGVVCLILMVVTMILTSLAIVREREIGTLEQLIVTPLKPSELMLGKIIPFALLGFFDVLMILFFARVWFGVPIEGSVALLLALTAVFLMSSLGLGLFISTISRTQQQAMMTSFFIMMPSVLLSGFIFPIANMPKPIQMVTYLIPLRYFMAIVRDIFLKGSGVAALSDNIIALLIFGVTILTLSSLRFKKRMG